jgi:phage protein D
MGLSYTPIIVIHGDNADLINGRLLSWELIDVSGRQSDQLTLTVDTQGIEGLPTEGQTIGLSIGYNEDNALTYQGEFKITRVTPRIYPDSVTIVATPAKFHVTDQTAFKQRHSNSFYKMTLGEIFRHVITPHGYSPRVAPELDNIMIDHIDQCDETDMSFLTRIAKRYDAVTKPVNNLYVLARRGQVQSISGRTLTPVRFSLPAKNEPTQTSFIQASADLPSRTRFNGVVATYWDAEQGKEISVQVGKSPFKKLRNQHDSAEQATTAADGELRNLARTGVKIYLDVPGHPDLVAEGLIELSDSFPSYMRGKWSIDRVVSRGSKGQGYRCSIEATESL